MAKSTFVGREAEIEILRSAYFDTSREGSPSTRVVVLLAEPGLGKTRIVQEFFGWLSTYHDGVGGKGYWPDELDAVGNNLLVSVPPQNCNEAVPMPFLWWGIRVPEGGEIGGTSTSVLGAAINDLKPHLEPMLRARRAQDRARSGLKTAGDAAVDVAIEAAEIFTGLGMVKTVGKAAIDLLRLGQEQLDDIRPLSLGDVADKHGKNLATTLIDDLRSMLADNRGVPGILVIDDAQFSRTDPGVAHFIGQLLNTSERENWPLLVVVTHWEREWWDQSADDKVTIASILSHRTYRHRAAELVHVRPVRDLSPLLSTDLPGLTSTQSQQILQRADGNPRYLVEIIALANENPQFFVGRNLSGPLTETGAVELLQQTVSLYNTIKTRLAGSPDAVRRALSLASLQGSEFARALIERMAGKLNLDDMVAGIVQAELPHAFVRGAGDPTTTFVQGIYREVAARALPALLDPDEARSALVSVVRETLLDPKAYVALADVQRSLLRKLAVELMGASDAVADTRLACSSLAKDVTWMTDVGDVWGAAATAKRYVELARTLADDDLDVDDLSTVDFALSRSLEHRIALEAMDRHIAVLLRDPSSLTPVETIALTNRMAFRARRSREMGDDAKRALDDVDSALQLLRSAKVRAQEWPRNGDMFLAILLGDRASMKEETGDTPGALEDFAEAIALADSIRLVAQWDAQEQHFLANLYSNRGVVQDDDAIAEADLSMAIELRRAYMGNGDQVAHQHLQWLANGHINRARRRERLGNIEGAHNDFREAARVRAMLSSPDGPPVPPEFEIETAEALKSLGEFYGRAGHREGALETFKQATDVINRVRGKVRELDDQTFQYKLAEFVRGFALSKRNAGLHRAAHDDMVTVIEILDSARERDPASWTNARQSSYFGAVHDLANAQADLGQYPEALDSMIAAERGREALRQSMGASYSPKLQRDLVRTKIGLGSRLMDAGRRKEALLVYDQGQALLENLPEAFFTEIGERKGIELAGVMENRARCLRALGQLDAGRDTIERAIALREKAGTIVLADLENLAGAYHSAAHSFERVDDGRTVEYCNKAFAIWGAIKDRAPESYWTHGKLADVASVHSTRGIAFYRLGQNEEAIQDHQSHIFMLEQVLNASNAPLHDWVSRVANGYHNLAMVFQRKADTEAAVKGYRTAIELRETTRAKAPDAWSPDHQEWLGNGYQALWTTLKNVNRGEALQALDQATVERQKHLEMLKDSAPAALILQLGNDYYDAGDAYSAAQDNSTAIARFSASIQYRERAKIAHGPAWTDILDSQLAGAYLSRARSHFAVGDLVAAALDADRSIDLREPIVRRGGSPQLRDINRWLSTTYTLRAEARKKDFGKWQADLARSLQLLTEQREKDPESWTAQHARERLAIVGALGRSFFMRLQFGKLVGHMRRNSKGMREDGETLSES